MQRQTFVARVLLLISILLFPLLTAARPLPDGAVVTRQITLTDLGITSDETLASIRVDRVYGVNWPQGWKPEETSTFKLSFSHSPSLKNSSSVAIDWNGTRLGSTLLTSANIDRGTLEVEIPANLVQPGYNALKLSFYMGIHDDFCEDIDNPAIWATVHVDSLLSLAYTPIEPALELSQFPNPFVDESSLIENQVTFVVPDQPTAAELNAVAILSVKLGETAAFRTLTTDVVPAANAAKVTGNRIYVGLAGRLPAFNDGTPAFLAQQSGKTRLVDANQNPIAQDAGLVAELAPDNDPYSTLLVVSGETEAGLLKAARALGSDTGSPRLTGSLGIVLDVPAPVLGKTLAGQVVTLEDFGYADVVARGVRDQTINYNIPLTLAWQANQDIPLNLHFSHSTLLSERQSAMNIALNGTPVSSIVLNKGNAADAWATVNLPSRLFVLGANRLTIQSTIKLIDGYVEKGSECGENYETEAWVSVFSDSNLNLPGPTAGMAITLMDYPYAYVGDASLAQLTLVVPDQISLTTAKAVAQITTRLGRYAGGGALYPVVQTATTALAAQPQAAYQILIGKPTENAAIQKLNDALPLPYQSGSNEIAPSDKLAQVVSGSTGTLQVVQTQENQVRLVVAGTTDDSLLWAANAISDPEMMVSLKGDAALLDAATSLLTLQVREPQPAPTSAAAAAAVPGAQAPAVPWVLWTAAGFVALTALIVIVLWISETLRRRQVKKAYEA